MLRGSIRSRARFSSVTSRTITRTRCSHPLAEAKGEVTGFSCYRIDDATGLAIGVLNGVLPDFRGRGIYHSMLRRMLRDFGSRGLKRFAIATQAQNVAVQRIWVGERLALLGTYNTIHVNALLSHTQACAQERPRDTPSDATL